MSNTSAVPSVFLPVTFLCSRSGHTVTCRICDPVTNGDYRLHFFSVNEMVSLCGTAAYRVLPNLLYSWDSGRKDAITREEVVWLNFFATLDLYGLTLCRKMAVLWAVISSCEDGDANNVTFEK